MIDAQNKIFVLQSFSLEMRTPPFFFWTSSNNFSSGESFQINHPRVAAPLGALAEIPLLLGPAWDLGTPEWEQLLCKPTKVQKGDLNSVRSHSQLVSKPRIDHVSSFPDETSNKSKLRKQILRESISIRLLVFTDHSSPSLFPGKAIVERVTHPHYSSLTYFAVTAHLSPDSLRCRADPMANIN